VLGAAALATRIPSRGRAIALGAVLATLLVAPASWSAQTLGHATNGTFPAGGPSATAGFGGPGGGPGGGGRGFGGGPVGGAPPAGVQGRGAGGPGGGGPFGGDTSALAEAVAYARAHGGGTVAVSSQQGAAATIIDSGADVVALGGFSGRESEVSVQWLADAVRSGQVRWVLAGSGGGLDNDGRVGATTVMAAVQETCPEVSSVSGLYDCAGQAEALAAAA
jgi:hypothetical protein